MEVSAGSLTYMLDKHFKSSLYVNAIYIMLNSATSAILGFVFWNLMAHHFPPASVGIASAIVSASGLTSSVGRLGLGTGLTRFVPESGSRGRQMAVAAFWVGGIASVTASAIYLFGIPVWSPALGALGHNTGFALGFLFLTGATTVGALLDNGFIAQRAAKYAFWRGFIASVSRIPLPYLLFAALGGYGIFFDSGIGVVLSLGVSAVFFFSSVYPKDPIGMGSPFSSLRPMFLFCGSDYLATLFTSSIGFIFPIMILNIRGAEESAYFYIAWMIGSVISIVPGAVSHSLVAESAHCPEQLSSLVKKSFVLSFGLLIPVIVFLYVLTPWLLGMFGVSYAEQATPLMRWLLVSNVPIVANALYSSVNQVKKRLGNIIFQSIAIAGLTITMGLFFVGKYGLAGLGIGYALGNLVVAVPATVVVWKTMRDGCSKSGPLV